MKVRLALSSSRGASGSVDALAETSPVGAPGINAIVSAWLSSMAFRDRCQLLDELVEMNRTVLVWVAPFDADDLIDDLVSGYAAQLDHLAAA